MSLCMGQLMDAPCVAPSRVTQKIFAVLVEWYPHIVLTMSFKLVSFLHLSVYIPLACWRYSYGSETCTLTQLDWRRLESLHMRCQRRIVHIRWHNNEVLRRTGLLAASSIVRKRLHVARLAGDVPANRILQTCCEAQDGVRPWSDWRRARGRPPTTWTQQIFRDTGVTVTNALRLAEDRSFWRQIATAWSYGWTLSMQEGMEGGPVAMSMKLKKTF